MKKLSAVFKGIREFLENKKFLGVALDDMAAKSILGIILIIAIASMLPSERPFEYSNLTVGSVAREEIIAPFTFPIIKSQQELEKERQKASLSIPPVFNMKSSPLDVQKIKLKSLFDEIELFFKTNSKTIKSEAAGNTPLFDFNAVDSLLKQIFVKYNVSLNATDLKDLYDLYEKGHLNAFYTNLLVGFSAVYKQGIIDIPKNQIQEEKVSILHNGMEEETSLNQVLDMGEARDKILDDVLQSKYPPASIELRLAPKIVAAFLTPDLIYDQELTAIRKDKAIHEVPTTSGFVHKDQRIVDSHEVVTPEIYLELQSLAAALQERSAMKTGWERVLFFFGKYLYAFIITVLFGFYIFFYRPRIFGDNKMLLLITTVVLLQFFFAVLVVSVLGWNYLSIPVTLAPMLLSMLLDASIGFVGTVIISIILGASQGNNFYLALMTFVVGTIALFSVQKIRNRGQMFRAILYIMLGYMVLNFSYGFLHYEAFKTMVQDFFFFEVPNAILAPTAVFLLIGVFEKFFDVTTDITLLELSDLNNPLLKRLSVEAPGTFHHSIIVGNLAEAAAKAVGANSLLARVGCYYHDIGKMQRAEYFVENQAGSFNKHENLTPTMSSLILSKHVKAGMDLAEQYGLPYAVRKFIPEHHGTSLMAYFYHKAKETMDPKDINENDFRYPGPKPQSKETAIAMMADTVEAASRTLANPTLQRLNALVEQLIEKRFQENELDECDLTLSDLSRIREAFVPILMGIHHLRVEYPGDNQGDKRKKAGPEKPEPKSAKKKEPEQKTSLAGETDENLKPVNAAAGSAINEQKKNKNSNDK